MALTREMDELLVQRLVHESTPVSVAFDGFALGPVTEFAILWDTRCRTSGLCCNGILQVPRHTSKLLSSIFHGMLAFLPHILDF
jgi:hypothetical protein